VPICFAEEETCLFLGPKKTVVLLAGYSVG
jgi:hypothetical protein